MDRSPIVLLPFDFSSFLSFLFVSFYSQAVLLFLSPCCPLTFCFLVFCYFNNVFEREREREREREKEKERERGGGGGGLKDPAHFALQILHTTGPVPGSLRNLTVTRSKLAKGAKTRKSTTMKSGFVMSFVCGQVLCRTPSTVTFTVLEFHRATAAIS